MSDLTRDVSNALNASAQAASHVATAYARMLSESEQEKALLAGVMKSNEETLKNFIKESDQKDADLVLWKTQLRSRTKELEELRIEVATMQLNAQIQTDSLKSCTSILEELRRERELFKKLEVAARHLLSCGVVSIVRSLKGPIGEIDKHRHDAFLAQAQKEAEARRG